MNGGSWGFLFEARVQEPINVDMNNNATTEEHQCLRVHHTPASYLILPPLVLVNGSNAQRHGCSAPQRLRSHPPRLVPEVHFHQLIEQAPELLLESLDGRSVVGVKAYCKDPFPKGVFTHEGRRPLEMLEPLTAEQDRPHSLVHLTRVASTPTLNLEVPQSRSNKQASDPGITFPGYKSTMSVLVLDTY